MNYLTVEDLLLINLKVIDETGGAKGAVNEANLYHVCHRIRSVRGSILIKTAYLLHTLAYSAHAFTDGNKRTALVAAARFLQINGYVLQASEQELVGVALLIAAGVFSLAETKNWLKQRIKKKNRQLNLMRSTR